MIIALNFTQNSKNRALRNGVEYLRYPNNVQKNVRFLDRFSIVKLINYRQNSLIYLSILFSPFSVLTPILMYAEKNGEKYLVN